MCKVFLLGPFIRPFIIYKMYLSQEVFRDDDKSKKNIHQHLIRKLLSFLCKHIASANGTLK